MIVLVNEIFENELENQICEHHDHDQFMLLIILEVDLV